MFFPFYRTFYIFFILFVSHMDSFQSLRIRRQKESVLHSQRRKDIIMNVFFRHYSADFFYHCPQHNKTITAILPFFSRFSSHAAGHRRRKPVKFFSRLPFFCRFLHISPYRGKIGIRKTSRIRLKPRSMGQQMKQINPVERLTGKLGQNIPHLHIKPGITILHQLHQRCCRKGFGNGCDSMYRIRPHGIIMIIIMGQPQPLFCNHFPVF